MTTASFTEYAPFADTVSDTMIRALETATKFADASTRTYFTALNAALDQQKRVEEASLDLLFGMLNAGSDVSHRVAEATERDQHQVIEAAGEATRAAGRSTVSVARAASRATASPSRTSASRRPRRDSSASSTPASEARHTGPAGWAGKDYDSLTAAEIVEKLPHLSQRELTQVETYELAHDNRQTVLHRIEALRGQEPVPGYDELTVPEIHKLLAEGDEELATRVRNYERSHKSREGVLNAATAQPSNS